MKTKEKGSRVVGYIGGETPTNGAERGIAMREPYCAEVTIVGIAPLLFHRYNVESVKSKAGAAKGSEEKKTDDVESYVWRNAKSQLCLPGEYLRMSVINAAKYRQDPRSPRKSAMDLFKAGLVSLTPLASLGVKDWDYMDERRVVVHGSAIPRSRPAMKEGWQAVFQMQVLLPEYIDANLLNDVIQSAGKLVGVGDFRPTYGRFVVTGFKVLEQ